MPRERRPSRTRVIQKHIANRRAPSSVPSVRPSRVPDTAFPPTHPSRSDEVIEQVTKTTIPEIFAESGEDGFREIETQVLAEIAAYKKCVVATGGGVVKKKANWMHLRNGVVLCLTGTPTLLAARITRDGAETRPLFKDVGDDVDAIAAKVEEMMKERAPMYANADVQVRLAEAEDAPGVEGETLDELNVRIMRCVRKRIEDDDTKDRLRSEPKPGDITITGA